MNIRQEEVYKRIYRKNRRAGKTGLALAEIVRMVKEEYIFELDRKDAVIKSLVKDIKVKEELIGISFQGI